MGRKKKCTRLGVCREKDFLCATLWVSVVKLLRKKSTTETPRSHREPQSSFTDRHFSRRITAKGCAPVAGSRLRDCRRGGLSTNPHERFLNSTFSTA